MGGGTRSLAPQLRHRRRSDPEPAADPVHHAGDLPGAGPEIECRLRRLQGGAQCGARDGVGTAAAAGAEKDERRQAGERTGGLDDQVHVHSLGLRTTGGRRPGLNFRSAAAGDRGHHVEVHLEDDGGDVAIGDRKQAIIRNDN